ncbi:MAG: putative HNH restriction endonuclease, partial [Alphaproteobacteria bacterium]
LCANCHRLAHTKSPPIPLDELRELLQQEAIS